MAVLDDIIVGVRQDLLERQQLVSLERLQEQVEATAPALDPMPAFRSPGVSIIAEVKRSSPSKGALASIDDPAGLAYEYEQGGAAAISVLTEKHRFNGSLDDLRAVRARVRTPVLRKDFIVDEYQLWEARAAGADLALLIVAALSDARLATLLELTGRLGLTALVETHTELEVKRALDVGAELIGVNNRNLKTLEVDNANFARLAADIPAGIVKVAESGVRGPDDVAGFHREGADVVLVGEALVKDGDPRRAVSQMIAAGR